MFTLKNKVKIAKGIVLHSNPLYVQFYITARCNLTCQQCNIIYANSDVRECTLAEIEKIAENLAKIGVAIVLLTGGEPFVRKDLPQIINAFVRNGIHVRMQTNGLASEAQLEECVKVGGCDISISLDTLYSGLQNSINGDFKGSWERAVKTISTVSQYLPPKQSFAAFGCVLSPDNIEDIEDVVRFGTAIGWFTSLVPIHVVDPRTPMNFRTYDDSLAFRPEHYSRVDALMDKLRIMKGQGHLLYDSDEYLEDIKRFVKNEPIQWRRKNDQCCDSPSLYFAIIPNGDFAVCCDHRLPGRGVSTFSPDFPKIYRDQAFKKRVTEVAQGCIGCMYGSYPEITITARYWEATVERMKVFLSKLPVRDWPLDADKLNEIAVSIRNNRLSKIDSPKVEEMSHSA